jgi:hypothetical protein
MSNKPGSIQTIFGNPVKLTNPIDQAKLIRKISDTEYLEQWEIEYLNEPGHLYIALIRKDNELEVTPK